MIYQKKGYKRKITNPDLAVKLYCDHKLTGQEIADRFHCTRQAISQLLHRRGVKMRSERRKRVDHELIARLARRGVKYSIISKAVDCTESYAGQIARKQGIVSPTTVHRRTLLTTLDRSFFYDRYVTGWQSMKKIADIVSCSMSTVRRHMRTLNIPIRPRGNYQH